MKKHPWAAGFPGSIMVCDPDGIVLEMNDAAAQAYGKYGGLALLGTCIFGCHPEPALALFKQLMADKQPHAYTITENGRRYLIYQSPWYEDGQYAGFIELWLPATDNLPDIARGVTAH
jgi:PAS domain-containing protein